MNVLKREKQLLVLSLLVEGNSIRSTERVTGVHRDTIMRLLVRVGDHCRQILDERMRDLDFDTITLDEVWTFLWKKERQKLPWDPDEYGHVYTYFAIDPVTKLIPCHLVGKRDDEHTWRFIANLSRRLRVGNVQVFTDGYTAYQPAIEFYFRGRGSYGQVVKSYHQKWISDENPDGHRRYSPVSAVSVDRKWIFGTPRVDQISTSHVERLNLTLRMSQRRWTRLTNAFSKKLENMRAAANLFVAHYNFCRIHGSLGMTPAMAYGLVSRLWSLEELIPSN